MAHRARGDGGEGAGQAGLVGEAAVAGGAPVEDHGGADQLQEAHRGDGARTDIRAEEQQRPAPANIGKEGIFLKSNSSIVGPSEGIPLRFPDRINEHEIELVMIIGKQGTDIPKDKAQDYIAGYALGLDMTRRGSEDRSFRKSIDGYSVLGPWMVTADEFANPDDVTVTLT